MAGSGTTLTDLYTSAQKLKLDLQGGLERLEKLETAASVGYGSSQTGRLSYDAIALSPDLTGDLGRKLRELQRLSSEMDRLYRSQVQFHKSQLWKRKVEMITEEADSLKQGLDKYLFREQRRQREATDRAELLHRVSAAREGAEILSEFDADKRDMETAKNSANMLEETLLSGYATLKRMAEQREVLKGAQRRALDVLNYIGLSDAVLKKINRRHVTDKLVSYGGMVLVLLVVFVVWHYTR